MDYYIGPRLISSTGWKQPSLSLSGIYNRWKASNPKTLDWFLNFLSQKKELDYETLSAGGKAIVKDFGFDINVFQRKRNVKIGPPEYADSILFYTGRVEMKKTTESDEVKRLREELRKCREGEDDRPPPPLPPKEEEEVITPPPLPPPSQPATNTRPFNQMDLQKTTLKKTPQKEVKKEEKDELVDRFKSALDKRRQAIAPPEDEGDEWVQACIVCSRMSFTQCECCSEIYCSEKCQRVNH